MASSSNAERDMIFVSHANPEDNEFSRWLTLQLAKDGYPVWCDLTQFLGGEHFWDTAENAIRNRTIRFLYVLSRTSNHKEGPRNELHIAMNVARANPALDDFIIPLHIDDLPYSEINVQLTSLIAVPFEQGWAAGYHQLLDRLETHGIQKRPGFCPQAVNEWWRKQFSATRGVANTSEKVLSNWLPIVSMPEKLYFHGLKRYGIGLMELQEAPPHPAFIDGAELVTFAPSEEFSDRLTGFSILGSRSLETCEVLEGRLTQVRNLLVRLLREAWEARLTANGLGSYALADGGKCFFFKKPPQDENLYLPVPLTFEAQRRPRAVIGYSTVSSARRRYWHFAIQGKAVFHPQPMFSISNHVVFSDDGQRIWTDHNKMHKARRRQCKMWQNDEWRDRMLAMLAAVAESTGSISLPVGPGQEVLLNATPTMFESPISFQEPARKAKAAAAVVAAAPEHSGLLPSDDEDDDRDEYYDSDNAEESEEDVDEE